MSQILGRASPSTCGRGDGNGNEGPPRPQRCSTQELVIPDPVETRRGRHAPRRPLSTRVAAVPKVSLAQRTGEAEGETESDPAGRGRGWPAFSHVEAELATRGKRPQAPEACVRPRPGGMTVRFGFHGLDLPGAHDPQPPACPTQPASERYL